MATLGDAKIRNLCRVTQGGQGKKGVVDLRTFSAQKTLSSIPPLPGGCLGVGRLQQWEGGLMCGATIAQYHNLLV